MEPFVQQSLAIIHSGQAFNGAYVACPQYPTYHYSWFRDGTFIAYAMDLWQEHESAERFYLWASQNICKRAEAVERCEQAIALGTTPNPADLLDTRYTLDGEIGQEDWPNFQLDGFGTLLWGLARHLQLSGKTQLQETWAEAANLLIRYLSALWQLPNYDCWEEFPENIAVSTLATLYAGLKAAADLPFSSIEKLRAEQTALNIKNFVFTHGVYEGHLLKQINGKDAVDGSLLWACVPFGKYGLLEADEPLMQTTVARIERDLIGKTGGVHRYQADTYYGGGEWILLTALLGEYHVARGDGERAHQCRTFVERQFTEIGLPEQNTEAPLAPSRVAEWVARWGEVARPLLWSHANYLTLLHVLQTSLEPEGV